MRSGRERSTSRRSVSDPTSTRGTSSGSARRASRSGSRRSSAREFEPQTNEHSLLRVDDVAAAREELEAKGVEFTGETFDTRRLPHGALLGPGRQPLDAPPAVQAVRVMQVEHVDFVSFLTQDIPRAKHFYSEVLGLEIETEGESDMEFRAGQVTLDIFDPSSVGQPSRRARRSCAASPGRRRSAGRARSQGRDASTARRSRRACATWRPSRIPTATRSCCIAGTRRWSDERRAGRLRLGADA